MKKTLLTYFVIAFAVCQSAGQGMYIEFKMSSAQSGLTGTSKAYSRDGNTRSEVTMSSAQMPGMTRVSLMLKDKPNVIYQLNVGAKTYSEMAVSPAAKTDEDPADYEVTVLGKEKVNGYNSTHVKLTRKSQQADEEAWLSTEVLNYKMYTSSKSKYTTPGFYKALEAKGAAGFPVRMVVSEHGNAVQMDLVKAEMRSNDASLFSLEGYQMVGPPAASSGSAGASGGSQMSPADQMKRIQNMTPEERQQFVDQLRQRQQQQMQQQQQSTPSPK